VTVTYLVQHGAKEALPGDPGLTALGRDQAARTACWFARIGLTALYSSPLRRARETAEPIARAAGLAVQVDSRLRDRVNWQAGQPLDQFLADWDRSARDRDLALRNGESSRSAGERLSGFVAGLAGGPGPVAAVSHGGVTVDLLRTLVGDAALPPRLLRDGIPPCAITTLDDLAVIAIASTAHLAAPPHEHRAASLPQPSCQAAPEGSQTQGPDAPAAR
jgi:broad specificity phosphatase PhoE